MENLVFQNKILMFKLISILTNKFQESLWQLEWPLFVIKDLSISQLHKTELITREVQNEHLAIHNAHLQQDEKKHMPMWIIIQNMSIVNEKWPEKYSLSKAIHRENNLTNLLWEPKFLGDMMSLNIKMKSEVKFWEEFLKWILL